MGVWGEEAEKKNKRKRKEKLRIREKKENKKKECLSSLREDKKDRGVSSTNEAIDISVPLDC